LFLDEVGEAASTTQVKLLRFLQDGEIRRVGENEPINVDVRLIAATNQDLEKAIEKGRFREDLFYRLNVIPIHIPPLRQRRDDIPLLITHFLEKYSALKKNVDSVSPDAMKILTGYSWPGNVRELENVIERAVILTNRNVILLEDLPSSVHGPRRSAHESGEDWGDISLEKIEEHHILNILEKYAWNQKKASEILGVSTTTLWRKLKAYGIEPKRKD
jgi:transcriptional regulator with PAS, ATPase and Fis domain